jgi:hypothetical protein
MSAARSEPIEERVRAAEQSPLIMLRLILSIIFISISAAANALDKVSLNVGTLAGSQWQLQGIAIDLTDIQQNPQQLALTVARLSLPKPFDDLSLVNIRCSSFTWQNKELLCTQGRATLRSKRWLSPTANFSFHIAERRSSFKLTDLRLAGGTVTVDGEEQGEQWQLHIDAKSVNGELIQQLLPQEHFKLKAGKANATLNASGSHALVHEFVLTAEINGLTGQTKDGRLATEALMLGATLNGKNYNGSWQWQSHIDVNGGALYVEPIYLEASGQHDIAWDAQGNWDASGNRIEIIAATYKHSNVGEVEGGATVSYKDGATIEKARLSLSSDHLQDLSAAYLKPFFEQTALQGVSLAGRLKADFLINDQSLTSLAANFNNLEVKDASDRGGIQGAAGQINWSKDEFFSQPSKISWQQLMMRGVAMGPAELSFLSRADSIRLLKKGQLPLLDGAIAINHFSWQAGNRQEPEISFEGSVNNVSLEQLTRALNWTPLSGTISGHIPRVEYSNKTLSLGGELIVKAFDGEIKVSNLASSGLFTDFIKFHSDVEINNLDLDQLTGRFKFGGITGKLSGYVQQLYMENWRPVSFFAWLGTPENDDSRHRISQKAVQNIASIGGGGAADVLSRSFLRFFDTFGYDKLGIGCYLHDGVCQLMGVEARESGYAIVTGGGLPRIDVIGYNPRVDWDVLMERLKRITATDEVIVE